MSKPITCCKNCKNRFVGCHSVCEVYLDQRQEFDKDKQKYLDSIEKEIAFGEYLISHNLRKGVFRKQQKRKKYK